MNGNPIPLTIMTIASLTWIGSARAADVHVCAVGRDTNAGGADAPLASLEGARQWIAAHKLAGREPVTVWVHGGTYHLARTFHVGPDDSGTAEAPITYRVVPGDQVVLKGSLRVDPAAWRPWKDGIVRQSLRGTALEGRPVNQLFMNDKRMVRARYPNWDFSNPLRTGRGYLHAVRGRSTEKIQFDPADLPGRESLWRHAQTGIVHAFHVNNWGNFQFRIREVDWANHTILFGEGGWQAQRRYGVGVRRPGSPGSPFYVENILEELDAPFEWFRDTETEMLYFKPPGNVDPQRVDVEAAVIPRMIEGVGARHVHFDGFHLTQTRATFLDPYTDLARGDWAVHRGGAVYFRGCRDCSVRNFHIEQVGGNGIFVDGFNREVHITGCLIEDTGDSAVCFVGSPKAVRAYQTWEKPLPADAITDLTPGPKTDDYPARCSVRNCVLRDVGVYGKQTSGVLVSMAMDITIDHCSIYRIARAAVTFNDGTWGGHVMSNCDIYDAVLDTGEHGPFNSWGRERFWRGKTLHKDLVLLDAIKPVKLHHNRIGNYRSAVSAGNWTIDLDDGSSNFEIDDNLMLGSTLKLRDGYYRKVSNNIMVSAVPVGLHVWPADNSEDVFMRNIVVVAGATEGKGRVYQDVLGPVIMPGDPAVWGTFDRNLWWNVNAEDFGAAGYASTLAEWQKKQGRHDIFADPLFVDPARRDYRVKPQSPALKLGFKNFPMDGFGHQMTRIVPGEGEFENEIEVRIRPDTRGGEVHYTLDGSVPKADSPRYAKPLRITQTTTVRAGTFDAAGHRVGFPDAATLTRAREVRRQSWLSSLLAGRLVKPARAGASDSSGTAATRAHVVGREPPLQWAGLELVTISDFPDYVDASGGQPFGAFVVKCEAGSKAAKAGFLDGDTIVRIGSTEIRTLQDLTRVLQARTGAITCEVFRGYKHQTFTVKP